MDIPEIPEQIPVLPLPGAVLFPHSLLPLHIFEQRYREMLSFCLDTDRMFSVALMRRGITDVAHVDDVFRIAGVGLIRACVGRDDGTSNLILQGLARVELVRFAQGHPFPIAEVQVVESSVEPEEEINILAAKLQELCRRLLNHGTNFSHELGDYLTQVVEPDILGDLVASAFVEDAFRRQQILEEKSCITRLRMLLQFLKTALD